MSSKLHVLILPSWYPQKPGDINGSFFREQALALYKAGCRVGVIRPEVRSIKDIKGLLNKPYGLRVESDHGMLTYRWHAVNFTPRLDLFNRNKWIRIGEKLFNEYVKDHGLPDVLHVHSLMNAGFLACYLSKKYSIPYVITEHSTSFARGQISEKVIADLDEVVRMSSKNMAVSGEFKNLLNSIFHTEKWIYVPNIVSDDFFNDVPNGINEKLQFEFINVCILCPKKRVDLLIKAFSKAFKGNKDFYLKIGGDGPVRKELELLVEQEGISDQVAFLGSLSRRQVRQEVSQADAFVLSSEYETFGVVLIEALALGKPVIATRCGGPESIVIQEVGYLIENSSVSAMAEAMKELYMNHKQFNASSITEYCKSHFSEEAVITKLIAVYTEVVNKD